MARIEGRVTEHGPIVDLAVRVSQAREEALLRVGFTVPEPKRIRAVIDTGAFASGFHPCVFEALDLKHIELIDVLTPSTERDKPFKAMRFDVAIELKVPNGFFIFKDILAIDTRDFDPDEEEQILGLLGRDVLDRCTFEYVGPSKRYTLTVEV